MKVNFRNFCASAADLILQLRPWTQHQPYTRISLNCLLIIDRENLLRMKFGFGYKNFGYKNVYYHPRVTLDYY